jgi:hypothetical protein
VDGGRRREWRGWKVKGSRGGEGRVKGGWEGRRGKGKEGNGREGNDVEGKGGRRDGVGDAADVMLQSAIVPPGTHHWCMGRQRQCRMRNLPEDFTHDQLV